MLKQILIFALFLSVGFLLFFAITDYSPIAIYVLTIIFVGFGIVIISSLLNHHYPHAKITKYSEKMKKIIEWIFSGL
jgi:hypothetical protein